MMRSAELRNGQRHRVLEVWKAGYYAWRARPLSDREQRQSAHAHGTHRAGHRVARVMREAGIRAKSTPKLRVTTRRNAAQPAAPNVLQRRFTLETNPTLGACDRVWAADITYIPTREGWLYLAVILDLASRRVVGWPCARGSTTRSHPPRCGWRSRIARRTPTCIIRIAACSTRARRISSCSPVRTSPPA